MKNIALTILAVGMMAVAMWNQGEKGTTFDNMVAFLISLAATIGVFVV